MQPHELIGVIATTLTAVGTIFGIARLWGRKFAKKIFKAAVEDLDEKDVSDESYLGRQRAAIDTLGKNIEQALRTLQHDISVIKSIAEHNEILVKRNEILLLVNTHPDKVDAIEGAYDMYKKMGGNSYIDEVIVVWREEWEREIVAQRLRKHKRMKEESQ